MSQPTQKFLISGATGKQGGAVVDTLLANGQPVQIVALVRNPSAPAAEALKAKGVQLAQGSLEDGKSLVKAMDGVTGAFLMTYPFGKEGPSAEITQGKAFIDAAKKAGVPHVVFTSVEGAERKTGVPHFDSKYEVEVYLRASGLSYSIVRPVAFYDGMQPGGGFQTTMLLGLFEAGLKGRKIQMVWTKDIAYFAVQALLDPATYKGRAIPLAGDNLTIAEIQNLYRKVHGRKQGRAPIPGFMLNLLPKDVKLMFKWFHDKGYEADIPALRAEHPGLTTFEDYLRKAQ